MAHCSIYLDIDSYGETIHTVVDLEILYTGGNMLTFLVFELFRIVGGQEHGSG